MSGTKYIGMDVHISSLVVAVMDERGKVLMESILETKAPPILAFYSQCAGKPARNLRRRNVLHLVI